MLNVSERERGRGIGYNTRMENFKTLNMDEGLVALKALAGARLVDVRTPGEFAEGRIPGALNIPLDTIGPGTRTALPDFATPLFVYCRSGMRSRAACAKFAELGYGDVCDIGGILDYAGPQER